MLPFFKLKLVCSKAEYEYNGLLLHASLGKKNQFLSISNKHTSPLEKYTFVGKESFKLSVKILKPLLESVLFFSFCGKKW